MLTTPTALTVGRRYVHSDTVCGAIEHVARSKSLAKSRSLVVAERGRWVTPGGPGVGGSGWVPPVSCWGVVSDSSAKSQTQSQIPGILGLRFEYLLTTHW